MQRIEQDLQKLLAQLQEIETDWRDEHSERITDEINHLKRILQSRELTKEIIGDLLRRNFRAYFDVFRFFLEMSKDQFYSVLKKDIPQVSKTAFSKNPDLFLDCLVDKLKLNQAINHHIRKDWSWEDIILERLKQGRGSAIKGQKRGRYLEDKIEAIVKSIFPEYDSKCNFLGRHGQFAKAEFAIPTKNDPKIIFEAKAYGATGSKQTDVIGDIQKIVKAKKPSTVFLFVTDGSTWRERVSDLRKIVEMQNDGDIKKIYTLSTLNELRTDLLTLKGEFSL